MKYVKKKQYKLYK